MSRDNTSDKLVSLYTGLVSEESVNAADAQSVSENILTSMVGNYVAEYKYSKKSSANSGISCSCQNCFWRTNRDGSPVCSCYWYQQYLCT